MRLLMKRTTLLLTICLFVAYPSALYADANQPVSSVYVYKLAGTKQCETDPGITLVTMERDLNSAEEKGLHFVGHQLERSIYMKLPVRICL